MNYPRAFEICKSVPEEKHNKDCSWRSGLLCDCEVLFTHPEYIKEYNPEPPDWEICGRWTNGKWKVKRIPS